VILAADVFGYSTLLLAHRDICCGCTKGVGIWGEGDINDDL
jgi:hypothetical protein